MKVVYSHKKFSKDMNNIVQYSLGYLQGINVGKVQFFHGLGQQMKETISQFIDSNARVNPESLHHVYEWYETGSPNARLFDIEYTVSNLGLSFKSTFKQSNSIKEGSNTPFYDKARIMEEGIPVTITPRYSDVLRFEIDGQEIFTRNPVTVERPGGNSAGQFEKIFDSFFTRFFTQAFLRTSGIAAYLERPTLYKSNFKKGKTMGRSQGYTTGYRWIVNAGLMK